MKNHDMILPDGYVGEEPKHGALSRGLGVYLRAKLQEYLARMDALTNLWFLMNDVSNRIVMFFLQLQHLNDMYYLEIKELFTKLSMKC
jgi:hypothetical protein